QGWRCSSRPEARAAGRRRRGLYELRQPWDHDLPVAHGVFIPPLTTVNAIAVAPSSGLLKREETETGKRCRLSVPASLLSFGYPARTSLKKRAHSQHATASTPGSSMHGSLTTW